MTLFDNIVRAETRPKRRTEPLFNYCNTSGRSEVARIRDLLEAWFQRFPVAAKPDLCARFRSPTDAQHQGALFELYLHEILCCMGFEVQVHPDVSGGSDPHPDFLVSKGNQPCFYLEATIALSSRDEAANEARIAQVYDTLNQIHSPNFFLAIRLRGAPATPPGARRLRGDLEPWLSRLDPDEIALRFSSQGFDSLPCFPWSHDGWDLSFFPIAKPVALRGQPGVRPIGITLPEERVLHTHTAIKTAVSDKATKYGNLGLPFIVAVNTIDNFVYDTDFIDGLFGERTVTDIFQLNGTINRKRGRKPNGAWFGPKGPQNTRISAVLIAIRLSPWEFAVQTPELIHNPWAARPLLQNLWSLPQRALDLDGHTVEHRAGKSAATILGLPASWLFLDEEVAE